jgi:hypothetical protein
MVPGGTRFTGPAHPRPAPRVIDVEACPKQETLYEVLVVAPTASNREIRKVARALRRNLPDATALHDVCLAEQVLGRADLRAEYDALLGRLHAANQPIPNIGAAIEGSRLVPSFATRMGKAGRAGASATGKVLLFLFQMALALLLIVGLAIGLSMKSSKYEQYKVPEYKPIVIPRFEFDPKPYEYKPIVIPKFEFDPKPYEYKPIVIPKFEFDPKQYEYKPIVIPKFDLPKQDLPTYEDKALQHAVPGGTD